LPDEKRLRSFGGILQGEPVALQAGRAVSRPEFTARREGAAGTTSAVKAVKLGAGLVPGRQPAGHRLPASESPPAPGGWRPPPGRAG
jgi:hypothetical protein